MTYTQEQVDVLNARVDGLREALGVLEKNRTALLEKSNSQTLGTFSRRRYRSYANLLLFQIREIEKLL